MGPALAIEVRGLSHSYGERRALDGVEFSVEVETIFGLLGPNGGGKTTLFRLLSTLLPIQQGHVRVLGLDLRDRVQRGAEAHRGDVSIAEHRSQAHRRRKPQYQGQIYGLFGSALWQRIDLSTEKLGLRERLGERAETLSGGLKRRVEIAKGLLHRPQRSCWMSPAPDSIPAPVTTCGGTSAGLRKRRA